MKVMISQTIHSEDILGVPCMFDSKGVAAAIPATEMNTARESCMLIGVVNRKGEVDECTLWGTHYLLTL
jgi:hypothetical protein